MYLVFDREISNGLNYKGDVLGKLPRGITRPRDQIRYLMVKIKNHAECLTGGVGTSPGACKEEKIDPELGLLS